jgi:signal transduction histidine kinase
VRDHGKGMSGPLNGSKNLPSGFGLFNIRERLRSLGGGVEIASGSGMGCSVCLTVPGACVETPARE